MEGIKEEDENNINVDKVAKQDEAVAIEKDVCISWFRSRLLLPGFTREHWTIEHDSVARTFLFSVTPVPKVLFVRDVLHVAWWWW